MPNMKPEPASYYAHGKLLISGEYVVLQGALSLAVPLKYGQHLHISYDDGDPVLVWESISGGIPWMKARFKKGNLEIIDANNRDTALRLQLMLLEARNLTPSFLKENLTVHASSVLNFPYNWGIGSGSSLVVNIARWADCDPFELNRRVFGSSGYDIAAAVARKPILYQLLDSKPQYREVDFSPSFSDKLWLVYQNKKQNSKEAVDRFAGNLIPETTLETMTEITIRMQESISLIEFSNLMKQHEEMVAHLLKAIPVGDKLFADFNGNIKSLGAWGGDFMLAASEESPGYVTGYFNTRGFSTVIPYNNMILK
jgi:mevalonate kinase